MQPLQPVETPVPTGNRAAGGRRHIAIVLLGLAALLGGRMHGRADETRAAAPPSIARGLTWLREMQREDGAWSNPQFPALTALPLWAFAEQGNPADHEIVRRAVAFLLSCVQEDGGIYRPVPGRKGGGLSTYNTAICMTALHATGLPEVIPAVQAARVFIAGVQHFGDDVYRGGFGYDRETERPYTDLMNTHFVMEAMRRTQSVEDLRPGAGAPVDIDWDAALAYVTRLQNPPATGPANAGGFFYNPDDPKAGTTEREGVVVLRSYGSITYAGLLAMVYARVDARDPRVRSALDWAGRHWTLDENPGMGAQGLFFFYNVISRALDAARVDAIPRLEGDPIPWREPLLRAVIDRQRDDGSWINDEARFWEGDAVLSTAYSLLALQLALKDTAP